jgi:hypothetical protein
MSPQRDMRAFHCMHTVCTIALWAMIRATLIQLGLAPSTFHTSFRPSHQRPTRQRSVGPSVKAGCRCCQRKIRTIDNSSTPSTPNAFLIRLPFRVFRAICTVMLSSYRAHWSAFTRAELFGRPYLTLTRTFSESERARRITCLGGGIQPLRFSWAGKINRLQYTCTCYLALRTTTLPRGQTHPRGLSEMPCGWFPCMTEPHFSERSASLESHLRP